MNFVFVRCDSTIRVSWELCPAYETTTGHDSGSVSLPTLPPVEIILFQVIFLELYGFWKIHVSIHTKTQNAENRTIRKTKIRRNLLEYWVEERVRCGSQIKMLGGGGGALV